MKNLKCLIKSAVFAIVFELLCLIPMHIGVKYNKYDLQVCFLMFVIFVASAVALEFVKDKDTQNPLFTVPIFIIHLLFVPGRIAYLFYVNRNNHSILNGLEIYVLEFIVAVFVATIILHQIVFFLIKLAKKAIIKKIEPKPFAYKWVIKSILFAVIADLSLYASIGWSKGDFNLLIISTPILLLPAISYSFFKGDSDQPLLYNLIVFGTHTALLFFRFFFIAHLNGKISYTNYGLDPVLGTITFVACIEALLLTPLIFDTLSIFISKLLKKASSNKLSKVN